MHQERFRRWQLGLDPSVKCFTGPGVAWQGGGRDSNGEAGPQQGGSAQRLKTGKGVHRGGVRRTGKAVHPKALRVLDAEKNGGAGCAQ